VIDRPEETLNAYVRAFASLDPDAVVPFYHQPCLFIAPGRVALIADAGGARSLVAQLMEQARSQGYQGTEILDLEVRSLAEGLASLAGLFVRSNSSGEEIGRLGFSYTMQHDGQAWKIVVAVAHPAPVART
jgi:hypothetical protein